METQYSEIFNQIIENLLVVFNRGVMSVEECQKIYPVIIKIQLYNLPFLEKIKDILKSCDEYLLQNLWFNVFKKLPDDKILNIFQNEIESRSFCKNLWCHEIYQHHNPNQERQNILEQNLPSSSSELLFLSFYFYIKNIL